MRIAILSSFHPYRGGIAQFNASMLAELGKNHTVKAFNFKRQYPGLLFPGKTQYVSEDDPAPGVDSVRCLDTINPFSYERTASLIRKWKPDLLIMKYWMSFFAPSLGYVARRMPKSCKVVPVLDNVIPHEPHFFDKPLTKYFIGGCDGFVAMSETVRNDLLSLSKDATCTVLPHPLYTHFGERVPREKAEERLGLRHGCKNILFFGLIRRYKGLDILLEAFRDLPEDYQLIIAGEPYGSFAPYREIIDTLPGKDRVKVFPDYIGDDDVRYYFSAADVTVLPYRSATQSGISSISYHFEVPMIVTAEGGLKSAIGDRGTGIVVPAPESAAVRDGILKFFGDGFLREECVENIRKEKTRLSWHNFCRELVDFAVNLQ